MIKLNEVRASPGIAILRELGLAEGAEHITPNGGAIALGYTLYLPGAGISGNTAPELSLRKGRYTLATMCAGVGQGPWRWNGYNQRHGFL